MVLALVGWGLAGGAGWFFYFKSKDEKAQPSSELKPASSSVYLPLEPVVINLGDEGGGRFAQVGITFQIQDAKLVEDVKKVLPSIRNSILISLSERKAQDLLTKEGKERLAADIRVEAGRAFGIEPSPENASTPAATQASNPVVQVLFSSLIIQ
jgi:flagellar FliL protein